MEFPFVVQLLRKKLLFSASLTDICVCGNVLIHSPPFTGSYQHNTKSNHNYQIQTLQLLGKEKKFIMVNIYYYNSANFCYLFFIGNENPPPPPPQLEILFCFLKPVQIKATFTG